MATKNFDARTLVLVFENGLDDNGKVKYVRKSINTIAELADDNLIYDVANSLATLVELTLSEVKTDLDYTLISE